MAYGMDRGVQTSGDGWRASGQNRAVPTDAAATLSRTFAGADGWRRRQVFAGTSHGAELWASTAGRLVIVKHHTNASVDTFELIARRIQAVREAGVPAPATTIAEHGDDVLLIHDYMPGRVDPALTCSLLDDLVRIVECEAGLADESARDWSPLLQSSLTDGLDGYCEHHSLQTFSDASRALLQRIRQVGDDPSVGQLLAQDLVHYDLHSVNVVSDDGRHVSGIIDWDGVRAGDRCFDLANLAFTSLWKTSDAALYEQIWSAFLAASTHDSRVIYMHHVVLRQVDWVIRHPGLPPGPARTMQLAAWALGVTERTEFSPPPRS